MTHEIADIETRIGRLRVEAIRKGWEALADKVDGELRLVDRHLARIRAGEMVLTEGLKEDISAALLRAKELVDQFVWEKAGAFVHQQIIWVKSRPTLTRSVYLWQHEPCFFGWMKSKKPSVRKAALKDGHPSTVWMVPSSEIESKDHPTSKPVRLFSLPMLMHTAKGDVCYEPFSGSGSQIIAAEQTGRRCFAIELEPQFVQVDIDRWEAFTGKKAVLLSRGTPMKPVRPHTKRKGRAA